MLTRRNADPGGESSDHALRHLERALVRQGREHMGIGFRLRVAVGVCGAVKEDLSADPVDACEATRGKNRTARESLGSTLDQREGLWIGIGEDREIRPVVLAATCGILDGESQAHSPAVQVQLVRRPE